jgi:HPt (histidine-containing phosphotransfer) domain-containing protein
MNDKYDEIEKEIQREMKKLRGFYIQNLKERYKNLLQAIDSGNFEEINIIGHSMKGSGASYGFEEMSDLGFEIEETSKHQNLPQLMQLINHFEALLERYNSEEYPVLQKS